MKHTNPLHAWWAARAVREQRTLLLGGVVVTAALLWNWWLQPGWQQYQRLPGQTVQAQAQWQAVAQLAQQARSLQGASTVANALSRSQALGLARSLSAQVLGMPNLAIQESGDSITIQLDHGEPGRAQGLTATQLAQWLQAMRLQTQLQPRQVRLQRQSDTGRWQGDITFSGPPLQTP